MLDPKMELLTTVVIATLEQLEANPSDSAPWESLDAARRLTEDEDPDLQVACEERDVEKLRALMTEWQSGKRHFPLCDREVLKRAMKAFRKSLKVTRLAAETRLGGGPLSGGSDSQVVGVEPPRRYPPAVWMELVRQGRLMTDGSGTFELPPGG